MGWRRQSTRWRDVGAAALVLAIGNWPCARAWRTWGTLPTGNEWAQYVGKFCFDYSKTTQAGIFSFSIEGQVEEGPPPPADKPQPGAPCWGPCNPDGGLYLIVYDDEKAHWREAHKRWETLTCKERLADATWARRISPLPTNGILNRSVFVSEKIRPRFWYFTFASCGVQAFLRPVQYKIHTENILMDGQREFGVDEEGCFGLQLFFAAVFMIFACFLRVSTALPGRGESFRARPLLRLLAIAVLLSALGCIILSVHYGFYMMDGIGLPPLEVLGVLLAALSKGALSVLQLLTAKGWVLFYSPNEIAWRRFTVCTLGGIVVASAMCEIHGEYFHDWRTTLFLYESAPGMVILLLNLVLFVEATRSMYSTYWNEVSPEVREFYRTVSAAISLYYLTLPIIVILAGVFSPWVRQKYVARTEIISRCGAMLLLAYCLRPSRLDIIIGSRLEEGLDSDMEDRGNYSDEEMEECGNYSDEDQVNRPLKDGMKADDCE